MPTPIRISFQLDNQEGVNKSTATMFDAMVDESAKAAASIKRNLETLSNLGMGNVGSGIGAGLALAQAKASALTSSMNLLSAQSSAAMNSLGNTAASTGAKTSTAFLSAMSPIRAMKGVAGEVGGAFRTAGDMALRLSGIIYSMQAVGRGLKGIFITPYVELMQASEAARKFEMAIAQNVGGLRAARDVDVELERSLRNSSLTLAEMRQTGLAATRIASLSPQLGLMDSPGAAKYISGIGDMMARLQTLNPERTPELVERSVQQFLEGSPKALRTIGIDPKDIEAQAHATAKELQGNQSLMLEALQTLVRQRVSDPTLRERGELPSVSLQKLRDEFSILAERIALDSPLFDTVGQKFHSMMTTMAESLDDPEMQAHLKSIGESMTSIFSNTMSAGGEFLRAISGSASVADSPKTIAEQMDVLGKHIADWSKELPGIANDVGAGLHNIAAMLKGFASELSDISQMRDGPGGIVGGVGGSFMASWVLDKARRLDPAGREDARLQDAVSGLSKMGINGLAVRQASQGDNTLTNIQGPSGQDLGWLGTSYSGSVLDTRGVKNTRVRQLVEQIYAKMESDDNLNLQGAIAQIPNFASKLSSASNGAAEVTPGGFANLSQQDRASFGKLSIGAEVNDADSLYGGRFGAETRNIESLGHLLPDTAEKWAESLKQTNGYLDSILGNYKLNPADKGEQAGSFFQKINEFAQAKIAADKAFIDHIRNDVEPGLTDGQRQQIEAQWVARLEKEMALLGDGVGAANQKALEALKVATGRAALKVMEDARQLPPVARADLVNRAAGGQLDFERRSTAAQLGIPVDRLSGQQIAGGGLASIPGELQPRALQEMIAANVAGIKAAGGYAGSDDSVVRQQTLQFYEKVFPVLEGMQRELQTKSANGGLGDSDLTRMGVISEEIDKATEAMRKLREELNPTQQSLIKFGEESRNSITHGLGDAMYDLITRTGKVSDAFRSMADSIVHSFSNMLAQNAMNSLFGNFLQPQSGGQPGSFGGLAGAGVNGIMGLFNGAGGGAAVTADASVGASNALDSLSAGLSAASAAANGAVFRGGLGTPVPFSAFSKGGVVGKPHLALLGERSDAVPEAVLPLLGPGHTIPMGVDSHGLHAILPGGRKVGASVSGMNRFADGGIMGGYASGAAMSGGGGDNSVTLNHTTLVVDDRNAAEAKKASITSGDRNAIVDIISHDMMVGGKTRRAMNRGSGH